MKDSPFIEIEEINGSEKKKYSFENFKSEEPTLRRREKRIDFYYMVGNYLCVVIIAVFLGLLIVGREIPEFFIGMVGAVIGYYLSRKPFE
jgi:hypothetical protein